MADIKNPVSLSSGAQKIIGSKSHSHTEWSCEGLESVRKEIRDHYRIEQGYKCPYCRMPLSSVSVANAHIDHIVPKTLAPEFLFEPQNLCVACADCNESKRDKETRTPYGKERKRYPGHSNAFYIVHPHIDDYDDHILILNGYYIDKNSAKGNATIGICRLNRKAKELGYAPETLAKAKLIDQFAQILNEPDKTVRKLLADKMIKMVE